MLDSPVQHPWLWAGILAAPALWCAWSSFRPKALPKEADFNTFLRPGAKSAAQPGKAPAGRKKQAQDFSSFLKGVDTNESHRQPTSFSSFLRAAERKEETGYDEVAVDAATEEQATQSEEAPADSKPVAVLFGTEYGFSKEIAEKAAAQLKECGKYWPCLIDMAEHPEGYAIDNEQALLVVCSTQGDGVPPSEAREFCDWLSGVSAPKLEHTAFSVCALGDTLFKGKVLDAGLEQPGAKRFSGHADIDRSYNHFCACGKMLDARLEQLGAKRFSGRADINREDWKAVDAWIKVAVEGLDDLELKANSGIAGKEKAKAAPPKQKRWGKSRPYLGTIVASEGLCNISGRDDKDTIRVEIDLGDSGLSYLPGDALGILPLNCSEAVNELIQLLGACPDEPIPRPSWHYDDGNAPEVDSMPLHKALAMCYDLRSPKHDLLSLLLESLRQQTGKTPNGAQEVASKRNQASAGARVQQTEMNGNGHPAPANGHLELPNGLSNGHSGHENGHKYGSTPRKLSVQDQRDRLRKLLKQGDAAIEKYLEPRHVIDFFLEYPSAKPKLFKVLAALRPLLPRLYSISSSQLEQPKHVQVTVAVVRYASLDRERIGVTSTYLAERLQVGDRIPVYVHKNPDFRLPQDASRPVIMVGPGTGLAPFRSFMQERLLSGQLGSAGPLGQAVLYFGCRRSDQDYLYGSQMEGWAKSGDLTLFTAFSRQQAQKVYVQDRLRESGKLVWDLLEAGGHFYVCGDAAHMAGAVEEALLHIIESHQGQGKEASTKYLNALTSQQRYQRDVWF